MKKKQWQSKTAYDSARKSKDACYKAMKNKRAALSQALRRWIKDPKNFSAPTVTALIGCDTRKLFKRFEKEAKALGLDLARDYATVLEIDHVVPCSVFGELFRTTYCGNLEETLRACFRHSNLRLKLKPLNRRHSHPLVLGLIKNRRFAV